MTDKEMMTIVTKTRNEIMKVTKEYIETNGMKTYRQEIFHIRREYGVYDTEEIQSQLSPDIWKNYRNTLLALCDFEEMVIGWGNLNLD